MLEQVGHVDPVPSTTPTPLRPVEIASAGVFTALAVVVVSIGSFLPHLGAVELLAVVPYAVVGLRHRVRTVVAAAIAGAFVAVLVGGVSASLAVIGCAVLGGFCGEIRRGGRGSGTVLLVAGALVPVTAATAVGALALFAAARQLAFETARASVVGVVRFAEILGLPSPTGRAAVGLADALFGAWPILVAVVTLVVVPAGMLLTHAVVVLVARRVEWLSIDDPFDSVARADDDADLPLGPVPVTFDGVGFSRSPGGPAVLTAVDLCLEPGEFVAVIGRNGAGKSTFVSLLAGATPSSGRIRRPGRVGLGVPGGTAIVSQRAEVHVVGSTVREDLLWGLPGDSGVDVESLLARVGLVGLADSTTDALSGGQLQRLAVATAIARRPALLISDESTSMLDERARAEILTLLAGLPAEFGTTVVHVTHDPAEAAAADRVVGITDGRLVDTLPLDPTRTADVVGGGRGERHDPAPTRSSAEPPAIRLRGVRLSFETGTPWQRTALRSVDLDVAEGEGIAITGPNGSGKTTLAWVIAGLVQPTSGSADVGGVAAAASLGRVALSFQHARLQLQRPTVAEDLLEAAGRQRPAARDDDAPFVAGCLRRVGLPADLADRSIEALSGGQMRRVAIAGLLASRPRVLVLDEPLAGLDQGARRSLLELLGELRREQGLTLVVISHDLEDLALACDRTVTMTDGVLTAKDARDGSPTRTGPRRVRRHGLVLLPLPGTSPLHRVAAHVKLVGLAVATVVSIILPG